MITEIIPDSPMFTIGDKVQYNNTTNHVRRITQRLGLNIFNMPQFHYHISGIECAVIESSLELIE